MADNVEFLPIWKNNATPEERLMELAMMARKNPERFAKMVVFYQEESEHGYRTRYVCSEKLDSISLLGLIELGKDQVLRYIHRD